MNFWAADILILSHYFYEVLLPLGEAHEYGIGQICETSYNVHLFLHLHLGKNFHVYCVNHMELV